ncbi:hypothetical protein EWM62_08540 [Mucilaginibacter terrigena]|uniref:Carboxypeptidase regulatory-like domain-containing protein n=1 Tax=Mucilaginibacter terrigena TaxID=2492395 RepID=A0A4Q5LLZ8_9SPHI|nr:hypothetical protein [Mucilaginibacter terrigena]RYU90686.1 hypothetical protein EWM62_08540 [Mucilaginibacter terrigena]
MKRIFTILAVLLISLTACKKGRVSKDPSVNDPGSTTQEPVIAYGNLNGTIFPAGAAEKITLISDIDPNVAVVVQLDAITGNFYRWEIKPGNYHLIVLPKSGYILTTKDYPVQIIKDQTTAIGTIKADEKSPEPDKTYSFSYKLNGSRESYPGKGTFTGTDLKITGKRSEGTYQKLGYYTFESTISVTGVTGLGDYYAKMTYVTTKGTIGYRTWGSAADGGSAKVTVTAIDPVNKKISGSFTAKLAPIAGTTGILTVTEGTFNITY